MAEQWTLRFSRRANEDKYKIPRGEAAIFAEAVSILRNGPHLPDHQPVEASPNTYTYKQSGYLIAYEVLDSERSIRIVYFELLD